MSTEQSTPGKTSRAGRNARAVGRNFAVVELRRPPGELYATGRKQHKLLGEIPGAYKLDSWCEAFQCSVKDAQGRQVYTPGPIRVPVVDARSVVVEHFAVPLRYYARDAREDRTADYYDDCLSRMEHAVGKLGMVVHYGSGRVGVTAAGSGSELKPQHRAGAIRRKAYTAAERSGAIREADFLAYVYGPQWLTSQPAGGALYQSLEDMMLEQYGRPVVRADWVDHLDTLLKQLRQWRGLERSHKRYAQRMEGECLDRGDAQGSLYWTGVLERISTTMPDADDGTPEPVKTCPDVVVPYAHGHGPDGLFRTTDGWEGQQARYKERLKTLRGGKDYTPPAK